MAFSEKRLGCLNFNGGLLRTASTELSNELIEILRLICIIAIRIPPLFSCSEGPQWILCCCSLIRSLWVWAFVCWFFEMGIWFTLRSQYVQKDTVWMPTSWKLKLWLSLVWSVHHKSRLKISTKKQKWYLIGSNHMRATSYNFLFQVYIWL